MNRPSPTDDERDLLARARRRLPPDVDIVELSAALPTESDDMTSLSTLSVAAAPLLAGAVVLSGCSASPAEIRAAAATSKGAVVEVSQEVLGELTTVGRLPGPAEGVWRSCRDKAGWLQYFVSGRLDPLPEATRDPALVDRVTSVLAPRGYRLGRVRPDHEPITLEAVKGEVNVQVTGYTDQPFVVFDISGRCVEVDELDGELRDELPETVE